MIERGCYLLAIPRAPSGLARKVGLTIVQQVELIGNVSVMYLRKVSGMRSAVSKIGHKQKQTLFFVSAKEKLTVTVLRTWMRSSNPKSRLVSCDSLAKYSLSSTPTSFPTAEKQ